ncbi:MULTISPECIES: hypothetical protein [unclassified Bradyrhizobium]|nr:MULTISPECIES: hypothetical protein [unclassified Bradyrhizobium]
MATALIVVDLKKQASAYVALSASADGRSSPSIMDGLSKPNSTGP